MPVHLLLSNIYILLHLALVCFLLSPRFRAIAAVRKAAGIPGPIPSIQPYVPEGTHYLVPDLPELSLPLAPLPGNVTACGPIVASLSDNSEGARQSEQQLREWMSGGGEIVLVNFGSHIAPARSYCEALAKGLGCVLRKHKDLRVLWKLKRGQDVPPLDESLTAVLGAAWHEDRVKIVEWLDVAPAHLLMLESVVVSVHHGGANAYFESARSAISTCHQHPPSLAFCTIVRPLAYPHPPEPASPSSSCQSGTTPTATPPAPSI